MRRIFRENEQLDFSPLFLERYKIVPKTKTTLQQRFNRRLQRPQALVSMIGNIDRTPDEAAYQHLVDQIKSKYEELDTGFLMALFGTCYLGDEYVDHVMNFNREPIKHYLRSETLPAMYAQARELARDPQYLYIEIYSDGTVVPISIDGNPGN